MDKKYLFKLWLLCTFLIFFSFCLSLYQYRRREKWAKKVVEGWRIKYRPFDDDSSGFL